MTISRQQDWIQVADLDDRQTTCISMGSAVEPVVAGADTPASPGRATATGACPRSRREEAPRRGKGRAAQTR